MRFRTLAIALVTLAFGAGGASLVLADQGGIPNGGSAKTEYLKPGCGPDKTDGVAGNSGQHTGQPPKADDRADCPNPPGQQGNTTGTGGNSSTQNSSVQSNSHGKH